VLVIDLLETDFVSLDDFPLRWRFERDRRGLSTDDLSRVRPLSAAAAATVDRCATDACDEGWTSRLTFRSDDAPSVVLDRLRELPPAATETVLISWDARTAAVTDWELFVAHWDDFCYPASDDVTVLPAGGEWVLCYHHYEVFQFRQRAPRRTPNA
jgi:hypothetical protein